MNIKDMPFPGKLAQGQALRTEALKAINSVQIVAGRTPGGKIDTASELRAFFSFCADSLIPFDPTPAAENT